MNFPQLKLLHFGVYDSRVNFPDLQRTKKRTAAYYEIEIFADDCSGHAWLDGREISFERGRFLCVRPGQTRYSYLPFSCYYLHLMPQNQEAKALLHKLPDTALVGDTTEYVRWFNKLIQTDLKTEEQALTASVCLAEILRLALRDTDIKCFKTGITVNKKALLEAERYIRQNFRKKLTLEEMAAQVNLSPVYFHKLFTSYFRKTPNQYLSELKISHAKTKLLEETVSLSDIAFSCGFSSQSYFSYQFKRFTGKTPLAYRNYELSKIDI